MNRFWDNLILPIIEQINARYIVEIGSDTGINTRNILEYCVNNNAHMTAIDPVPQFDVEKFKAKYGDKFEIYKELSLSRLPLLENYNVILIDGDHNWYTVYNELKIIEKKFKGKEFPLIFLHDVGWPYARRDLYYNPENIPEAYRQPYKKLGMYPGQPELKEKGGLNNGLDNSIYENTPKNGVLTAVEDFIKESNLKFSIEVVDAFHGFGILYTERKETKRIVKSCLEKFELSKTLEDERVKSVIYGLEVKTQNHILQKKSKQIESQLKRANETIQQKETQIQTLQNQLKTSNETIQQKETQIQTLQNQLKTFDELIKQKDTLISLMEKQKFAEKEDIKRFNSDFDKLKTTFYEMSYFNNNYRSLTQRFISKFPFLYILPNKNNKCIKNALINIKGYRAIKKNNLLDIGYYLKNNSDVRKSGIDPLLHYIYHGFKEGRKPNSSFDSTYYLKSYGDVKNSNLNPLIHYSLYGLKEGRKTTPLKKETPQSISNIKQFLIDDPCNKAIRTLFFTHDLKMQGAQNSLYELVLGLKEKNYVNPIVYSPADGPLRNAYEKKGVKVIVGNNKLQDPQSIKEFNENLTVVSEKLEKFKIQFIHCNTLRTFYGIEIARKMGIPCTWNPRESEPCETYFDYLPEEVKKIALNCFSYPFKVIFVSSYTQKIWEHLNKGNFTTIHNALNTERLIYNSSNWTKEESRAALGIKENEIAIIQVGTISPRKGQKDIFLAINSLSSDIIDNIKIFIVGDKPSEYSTEIHSLYSQLPPKVKKSIFIIPETKNENEFFKVVNYYLAADILIFSSRIESYPRVILEALYFNLPIITTPVFGVKEQVENEFSALFYDPGNIEQLNEQLVKLVKDRELRYTLQKNTKKQLKKLSTHEEMIKKYAELILDGYSKNK